jgi:hypothetical protein
MASIASLRRDDAFSVPEGPLPLRSAAVGVSFLARKAHHGGAFLFGIEVNAWTQLAAMGRGTSGTATRTSNHVVARSRDADDPTR